MSWAPNETTSQLWLERTILAGVEVGNIAYGAVLHLRDSLAPLTHYNVLQASISLYSSCAFWRGGLPVAKRQRPLTPCWVSSVVSWCWAL